LAVGVVFQVMKQGLHRCANPSISYLSLDLSKQSNSPNCKITQHCFYLWCQIDTSSLNFRNAKRLCLFCFMRQKYCWNYFAFNQSCLAKGKIAPVVLLPHESKQKYIILHWRIRTGSDWWFSKILQIRTGSDSILSDQDWTWTEKYHSPLISGLWAGCGPLFGHPCDMRTFSPDVCIQTL